jgi:hypothetical protein
MHCGASSVGCRDQCVFVLFEKVSCYGTAISNAAGAILVGSGLLLAAFG